MSPFWADLSLVYCAAVWGATFFMVKDALAGVDPVALVAHRFLLSALLLAPWALTRKTRFHHLKESFWLGVLLFLLYVSQTVGLGYTSASNSGFITGLFVIFVPLFLLVFLGRPPTTVQWASSGLALAGLWLLTGGIRSANFGDVITLIAAATYAGHLLVTDLSVKADADPVILAFHQFWMTGVLAAVAAWFVGRPFAVAGVRTGATIVFLAVVPTLSAFFIQMLAQKTVPAVKVSLIFLLEPVFAAIFAWTIGGEKFSAGRAAGGGLIVAAMLAGELSKLDLLKGRRKEILPT
ncbi:MAG TPA: DMT family transporter [Candidatus Baltobacteraceae bacterium]|nr:DMT family transporter [Candidatus Baltobacteraceae bacterium]